MARIGWVACGVCGNPESSVSENAAGTLSVSCHRCQFSGYAKAGTKGARTIRDQMTPDEDKEVKKTLPEPEHKSTAPAAKPAGFSLESL